MEQKEGTLEFLGYEVGNLIGVYRKSHVTGTRTFIKIVRICQYLDPKNESVCNYEIIRKGKVKGHLNTHKHIWTGRLTTLHYSQ